MDVSTTMQALSDNVAVSGESYIGEGGLRYCGKCRTPSQTVISFAGKCMTVNCLCACAKEAAEESESAFRQQQREDMIQRNYSGMRDKKYRDMTFDNSDCELNRELNYCASFPEMYRLNAGIMFLGNVGTGKTFRAAAIGNKLISEGYTVLMDNVADIGNELWAAHDKQEYIDNICRYDLLILDDFGATRDTEYMNEVVYNIVNSRYCSGKPLIVTTNLTLEGMKAEKSMVLRRTYDRIFEMCCYPITVKGENRRRRIGNDKYNTVKTLLESGGGINV